MQLGTQRLEAVVWVGTFETTQTHQQATSLHTADVPSALVAEALALKAAVQSAVTRGVDSLRVFSDSKSLITLLSTKKNHVWIQGILFDIHSLSVSFSSISFHFIPRLGNTLADSIAKSALFSLSNSPACG